MRFALDATALPVRLGGAGNYVVRLAQGLADLAAGDRFFVFVKPEDLSRLGLPSQAEPVTVRLRTRPERLVWEQTGLPAALRRLEIDLLHSPHYTLPLVATRAARVVTFHDMSFFLLPQYHQRAKRLFFGSMIRLASRSADHIIADSDSTRADICRLLGLDESRVTTVHLAADEDFRPVDDPTRLADVVARLGLHHPFVLTVGTLEPRKNLAAAVRVVSHLRSAGIDVQLAVVGAKGWGVGPLFDEVRRLRVDDHVRFLGYVAREELPVLYSACDVFLYPSLYEGFGLPPLEALACGATVVVSNRSSLPEVVADGGLQYDPDREDTLAVLLSDVISDSHSRARWRPCAVARAALFSWTRTARHTYDIYRTVLARASR